MRSATKITGTAPVAAVRCQVNTASRVPAASGAIASATLAPSAWIERA